MQYNNVVQGRFISRPNRFIAYVDIQGETHICHVKNTGRCKELFIKDTPVILEKSNNPSRKTQYDLIAVYKGSELINIDSQAPNKVFGEWIKNSGFFKEITLVKPESKYKNSRFDFYIEADKRKIFVEVKGVTLEENGIVLFPDAPTERGVKHINELIDASQNGYEAYIFFIAQMKNCRYFTPNAKTHLQFAQALKTASHLGVNVFCVTCDVSENSLSINDFAEVKL